MNIQTLSRAQSKNEYQHILENCDFTSIDWSVQLDSDYLSIRNYMVEKYHELKQIHSIVSFGYAVKPYSMQGIQSEKRQFRKCKTGQ